MLLVASTSDICSKNMADHLIECYSSRLVGDNLYKVDSHYLAVIDELLHAEWLDEKFDEDAYVFLSKHRSEKNIASLTSHFTGNFANAEFGGNARELAYAYPSLQKCYMNNLYDKVDKLKDYQIVIEATHHGPTSLKKPLLFIEIGSSIEQWNDMHTIEIVCNTLMETLKDIKKSEKVGIGLGGTHYPLKFNKLLLEGYALGHIMPKYALPYLDHSMIREMIKKSVERIDSIILDWKGLKEKEKIKSLLSNYDLEVVKV